MNAEQIERTDGLHTLICVYPRPKLFFLWQRLHPRRDEDAVPVFARHVDVVGLERLADAVRLVRADDRKDAAGMFHQPRERDDAPGDAITTGRLVEGVEQLVEAGAAGVVGKGLAGVAEEAGGERAPGDRRHALGEALVERAVVERVDTAGVELDLVDDQLHRAGTLQSDDR